MLTCPSLDLFFHLSLSVPEASKPDSLGYRSAQSPSANCDLNGKLLALLCPIQQPGIIFLAVFALAREAFHHCFWPLANAAYTQYYFYNCQQLSSEKFWQEPNSKLSPENKLSLTICQGFLTIFQGHGTATESADLTVKTESGCACG